MKRFWGWLAGTAIVFLCLVGALAVMALACLTPKTSMIVAFVALLGFSALMGHALAEDFGWFKKKD